MRRVRLSNPPQDQYSTTTHHFKQSVVNEMNKIITGFVIIKFNTRWESRAISTPLKQSFERPKKLEEGDFILDPVKDFIHVVIGTEGCNFRPELTAKVKLTSNENFRVLEVEVLYFRDDLPSADALNEIVVKNRELPIPLQTLVAHLLPTQSLDWNMPMHGVQSKRMVQNGKG